MTDFVPMLAAQSKKIAGTALEAVAFLEREGWYFETKLDGVRCIAYVSRGTVRLMNRRGAEITGRYPEVVAGLLVAFQTETIVLDGEVLCYGDDGKPDFSRIHKRDAQPATKQDVIARLTVQFPATFCAFDVLSFGGDDLTSQPYVARRALLLTLADRMTEVDALQRIESMKDGGKMWEFTLQHGLEGLIAKQPTSPYRGGRMQSWVKLKVVDSVSAVAVGYDIGEGSRAGTIGAINLALIDNGQTVDIGRVGTGFKERDLAELKARMDAGELLVLEVEYANWGEVSKKLRFPSYKGIRTDVAPTDCVIGQLNPSLMLADHKVAALVQR